MPPKYKAIKQVCQIAMMLIDGYKFVQHGATAKHAYCGRRQYYSKHLKMAKHLIKLVRVENRKANKDLSGYLHNTLRESFMLQFAAYL